MMRSFFTPVFFTLALSAFTISSSAQAAVDTLKFPANVTLPNYFADAIAKQKSEFDRLFYRDSSISKNYTPIFMLDKIDNDSNYRYIFLAEYWISFHYKEMIPTLIKRVTNKTEVRLINTADLIIWERIQSGQLKFYGHGGISEDDLFTVAGRANHLLKAITGKNFGQVSMTSSQAFLTSMQKKWLDWFKTL